jgi:hypothetical protein
MDGALDKAARQRIEAVVAFVMQMIGFRGGHENAIDPAAEERRKQ